MHRRAGKRAAPPAARYAGRTAGRGAVLAQVLPLGSFGLAYLLLWCCGLVHPGLRLAVESFLCYQVLATKSLRVESMKVYRELEKGDLPAARQAVGRIVGRDTQALTAEGVTKAAVETVAENTGDGVVAPMVFLALGGAPLGLLYKAINTMDSMVGYRNERYLYFGRAPARLDDVANFIPARLAALLMVLAAWLLPHMDGRGAWRIFRRDRFQHKSPNSAQTEAVGCRCPGDPAGRRCLLLWQAGAQAHHRRPGAAGGGPGHPTGLPAFVSDILAVPGPVRRVQGADLGRCAMKLIHGGDVAGYEAEYGAKPLDFSANINPLGLPQGGAASGHRGAGQCRRLPRPPVPRAAPGHCPAGGACRMEQILLRQRGGGPDLPPGAGRSGPRQALVTGPHLCRVRAGAGSWRAARCSRHMLLEKDGFSARWTGCWSSCTAGRGSGVPVQPQQSHRRRSSEPDPAGRDRRTVPGRGGTAWWWTSASNPFCRPSRTGTP